MSVTPKQAVVDQCTVVKREVYHLKKLVEQIPHDEHREGAMSRLELVFNGLDIIQEFINSR